MEKDLFGESSVEEDSSDEDFPKPPPKSASVPKEVGSGTETSSSSSSSSGDEGSGKEEEEEEEEEGGASGGDEGSGKEEEEEEEDDDEQEEGGASGGEREEGGGDGDEESGAGGEDTPPAVAIDSQFPSTQDLFGTQSSSESSDSDTEDKSKEKPTPPTVEESQSKMAEGIFGETGDISSSDDDEADIGLPSAFREEPSRLESVAEPEEEVPCIDVEIPRCLAKLGTDQYFVKLPNFLSIETRPFDPALYEDEVEDEGEFLDEDGRARLKLKVENTIRWRKKVNDNGEEERESNARIVQWTDGSMSLYLGSEIFDIHRQPLQGEYSHLFVRQGTGLQGQAVFKNKLTFRPHSTDSQTHRKMTLSIADRFSKAQKIRVLPVVEKDPESRRSEMIRQEEQKLRASVRLESQQRRNREKQASKKLSASYLEPKGKGGSYGLDYEDEDEEGVSISAIKSSVHARSRKDSFIDDSEGLEAEDDDDDEEEEEEEEMEFEEERSAKSKGQKKRKRTSPEGAPIKAKGRKLVFSDDEEDSDD